MASVLGLPSSISAALRAAPTTDYVYSSLSFLRGRSAGELSGPWFVDALGEIGVAPEAVRQTLLRMTRTGALTVRREGRVNWYAPTPTTLAILDAGARTREEPGDRWDGNWTLVHLRFDESDRQLRDRWRDVLLVHGFGRLRAGVYVHPRDKTQIVVDAARDAGIGDRVAVFRGARHGPPADEVLVRELWDIPAIASRYSKFIRRFTPVAEAGDRWTSAQAFALRFAYMFEIFRITWDDPSLPSQFLPVDWPGSAARELARSLRASLGPPAMRFATEVAERANGGSTASARDGIHPAKSRKAREVRIR